jgi:hypothetical protein
MTQNALVEPAATSCGPSTATSGFRLKFWGGVVASIVLSIFVGWMIWIPSPGPPLLVIENNPFPTNKDVYGIKWKSEYSSITIAYVNFTGYSYNNLDLLIATGASIYDKGIYSGTNTCAGEFWSPISTAAMTWTVRGVEGGPLAIPMLATNTTWSNMYHVHCDGLSNNSAKIEIILAVVPQKSQPSTGEISQRGEIKWAKIESVLYAGARPTHDNICAGDCSSAPLIFPDEQPTLLKTLINITGSASAGLPL